jgi:hypothetical protein
MAGSVGRRTLPVGEVKRRVIEGLSDGVPLAQLCREEGMPAYRTVYDWLNVDEQFAAEFARARDVGFDVIAESVFDIIDDCPANSEHVQRAKMRAEYRLKLLAKWSPKRYGDKQELKHSGDPNAPVQVEHKGATPEQLAALTTALLAKPQGS